MDSFNDKSLICWTLRCMSTSLFETSTALVLDLLDVSKSGSEHMLMGIRGFKGSLGTVVRSLRRMALLVKA